MTILQKLTANLGLKVVSLILALFLWLVATTGMEGEVGIKVPVKYRNLSPGVTIGDTFPKLLEVTIAGPRMLLWLLDKDYPTIWIDQYGSGTGNPNLAGLEKNLRLHRGLRITRVYPVDPNIGKTGKDVP